MYMVLNSPYMFLLAYDAYVLASFPGFITECDKAWERSYISVSLGGKGLTLSYPMTPHRCHGLPISP